MNAKLTPGIIVIGVALATIAGPLYLMREVTAEQLVSQSYWLEVAATTVRSFAVAAGAAISIVGAAIGLPQLFGRWRNERPEG